MDGMEKILQKLAAENQAECEAILAAGRAEAESITAHYAARSAEEKETLLQRGREEAESRERRLVSAVQAEARRDLLAVKQVMMEKVYERAMEKLTAQSAGDKAAQLVSMLVSAAPDGEGTVYVNEADKVMGETLVNAANEKLGGKIVLASEGIDIPGGFILRRGNVAVNCAYDKLLRSVWERSTAEVAKCLHF